MDSTADKILKQSAFGSPRFIYRKERNLKEERTKVALAVPLKRIPLSVQYMSMSVTFVKR